MAGRYQLDDADFIRYWGLEDYDEYDPFYVPDGCEGKEDYDDAD